MVFFEKKRIDLKFENNVVVSGHKYTSHAANEVLLAGGNAFDAAIAAFFMAWVVEPTMAGAGGGGFANVYAKDGKSMVFDFFCQTPIIKKAESDLDFYPVVIDFGGQQETFHIGAGSVATPGNVAGIFELHHQLGTMPLGELANQAIQKAKSGVKITDFQAKIYKLTETMLGTAFEKDNPYHFNDQLVGAGDHVFFHKKADFIDYLTIEGPDAFYKGEVAQKFILEQASHGGSLSLKDLENYQVIQKQPLKIPFEDHQLLLNPIPSIGGASIGVLVHYFKEFYSKNITPFSKEHLDLQLKLQNEAVKTPKLQDDLTSFLNKSGNNKFGSTTHFGVTDRWGNAISITTSIGEGSGVVIPETEILLNNMLGEAALLPNGFHSWTPNTRLGSMMTPAVVIDENKNPVLVTGSSGAGRIPMAIFSVILNRIALKLSIDEAVNAPRVHYDSKIINIEPGFDRPNVKSISEWVEWSENSMFFGGANSIAKEGNRWVGCIDNRREGLVL